MVCGARRLIPEKSCHFIVELSCIQVKMSAEGAEEESIGDIPKSNLLGGDNVTITLVSAFLLVMVSSPRSIPKLT